MTVRSHRILLAEDNSADVYLVTRALDESGLKYELLVAPHGAEMIRMLEDHARSGDKPSLVILDLRLPRHDGLEILKHMRRLPEFEKVPVAIFTASQLPANKLQDSACGEPRLVRKPSNLQEFLALGQVFASMVA